MCGVQAHASAAKAAVDSLTRSLALEWGSFNIRVNGIAPGPVAGTAGDAALRQLLAFSTIMREQSATLAVQVLAKLHASSLMTAGDSWLDMHDTAVPPCNPFGSGATKLQAVSGATPTLHACAAVRAVGLHEHPLR